MSVFVVNNLNRPLMPTKALKAKKLLKQGKAEVVKLTPFTIKLKYNSSSYLQDITLGIDARIAANNSLEDPNYYFELKQIRKNNRSLHKSTILKGGIRKNNIDPKNVFGFELFDKVLYNDIESYVFGRRSSGYFRIALLDGTTVHNSVNYKKLKILEKKKTLLIIKKRSGISSPCLKTGVSMPSI